MTAIPWPPEYVVKRHAYARAIKLRINTQGCLQITLPKNCSVKYIPRALEEHRDWIINQLSAIKKNSLQALPEKVYLPAINQIFTMDYQTASHRPRLLKHYDGRVIIYGAIHDKVQCTKLLAKWLREEAKIHLPKILQNLSQRVGLAYDSVVIRAQISRWGSCASDKKISLNYKLLLLPPEIVEHVMLHELCHTVQFNHSKAFWKLVSSHDKDYKIKRSKLRKADQLLPNWLSD